MLPLGLAWLCNGAVVMNTVAHQLVYVLMCCFVRFPYAKVVSQSVQFSLCMSDSIITLYHLLLDCAETV